MACEILDNQVSSCPEQHEVVAIDFFDTTAIDADNKLSDCTAVSAPAIRLIFSGFFMEI